VRLAFKKPMKQLCGGGRCPALSPEEIFIYRDHNHMNLDFVRDHVTYLDDHLLGR